MILPFASKKKMTPGSTSIQQENLFIVSLGLWSKFVMDFHKLAQDEVSQGYRTISPILVCKFAIAS